MTNAAQPQAERRLRLADLLEQTSPDARSRREAAQTLPVLEPLAPLLPAGGLIRGTAVETDDTSLLLALATGPLTTDPTCWAAAVDLPHLGLAAAAGYGLPLQRLVVADQVGEQHFGEVVSALADACTVLMVRPPERLEAHLRRTGAVMLCHGRPWPGSTLRLEVTGRRWSGLGDGWGQLVGREVEVRSSGRGAAYRARTARLWLPDENGAVTSAVPDSAVGTGRPAAVAAPA
ncbi:MULTISPECIES: hypothetical protein [unclassified Kitasatospora]|uniref:hypothetical protein n=1 Tax=unclassified Kitasatospora TaxID=2633591 RepID=UPI0033C6A385